MRASRILQLAACSARPTPRGSTFGGKRICAVRHSTRARAPLFSSVQQRGGVPSCSLAVAQLTSLATQIIRVASTAWCRSILKYLDAGSKITSTRLPTFCDSSRRHRCLLTSASCGCPFTSATAQWERSTPPEHSGRLARLDKSAHGLVGQPARRLSARNDFIATTAAAEGLSGCGCVRTRRKRGQPLSRLPNGGVRAANASTSVPRLRTAPVGLEGGLRMGWVGVTGLNHS